MRVIMLKDVKGVGQRDTIKEVSDGYALNFLIAQGLAQQATPQKIAEFEMRKKAQSAESAARESEAQALLKQLDGTAIEVKARANEGGNLYEQLSPSLINQALRAKCGMILPPEAIIINAPIKAIGDTRIMLKLGTKTASVTVHVVPAVK